MAFTPTRMQATGNFGEDIAAGYLRKLGMEIVARNWRKGSYELDLICLHEGTLVFVEVKTRSANSFETPAEALNSGKRKSLMRAVMEYLYETDLWERPCRFDLVSVVTENSRQEVEHIEDVLKFDTGSDKSGRHALDCGHTPWQPW